MSGQLTVFYAQDGQLVRWLRGAPPTATAPNVPTAVVGSSPSTSSALIVWDVPVSDGGSPITGYVVTCTGASPVTLTDTDRSFTFGSLTAGSAHTLTVAAINAVGTGTAVSVSVTVQSGSASVPSVPTVVGASSPSTSSARIVWDIPADDGGSAVTGYVVTCTGATTVTTASTARSLAFTGLTAGSVHTLTVSAQNAVGTGTAVSKVVTVKTVVVSGMRFAGDPNPTVNSGRLYLGMSSDNKGTVTYQQFETQSGVPLGVHHTYDNGLGIPSIAVPDATHPTRLGMHATQAKADLTAGRLPLVSTYVAGSLWKAAGNGTFDAATSTIWTPNAAGGSYDTQIQAWISWCEGTTSGTPNLSGPVYWVVNHEPDAGNGGAGDGPPLDYRSWMNRIRWNLDKWEADNGKKRARLVFLTVHTAYMWAKKATIGSLGTGDWWPGDNVPDVVGVDCYAEHSQTVWSTTDSIVQSSNFKKFHAFVTTRGLTWALTEYGTLPANTNGHGAIKEAYDYCTDGTQDCVLMAYFNSGWWHLTNDNQTLSELKTEATKTTSIHVSDLGY